jgi:hypothetical protein
MCGRPADPSYPFGPGINADPNKFITYASSFLPVQTRQVYCLMGRTHQSLHVLLSQYNAFTDGLRKLHSVCRRVVRGERLTLAQRSLRRTTYIQAQYFNLLQAAAHLDGVLGLVPAAESAVTLFPQARLAYVYDVMSRCANGLHLPVPVLIVLPFLAAVRAFDRRGLRAVRP